MMARFAALLVVASSVVPTLAATANILIYTATAGFRHDSIPTAVDALTKQATALNVHFDHTEDRSWFSDDRLTGYDAVVFLSTTGEVLDDSGKTAFQSWLNKGGNFIGIHSASDTLNTTAFYGRELGAYFDYHPELQNATVDIVGPSHPSTEKLPKQWHVQDEMYNFKSDPRAAPVGATVVLSADESSYKDTGTRKFEQGSPHPTAWYQDRGAGAESGATAGRSFYTSLGHLNETWQDDLFMSHVLGGIQWAIQANTTRAFNSSGLVGAGASSSTSPSSTSSASVGAQSSSVPSSSFRLLPQGSASSYSSLIWTVIVAALVVKGYGVFA